MSTTYLYPSWIYIVVLAGIMGPELGSESITVGRKVSDKDCRELLENGLLDEPVYHGRNA
ncbi:hypothetical protein J2S00_003793 [Caldalkalibacillus uzonensis]|uniref:Uncharacterized protein n=1 Tax=Caldalkalibacillus uzonensis TaxID=353224 RepID=A0ABU0CXT4_9BACI|nr:hypothetical protein [Caldalkalibacillus uzonensis]